MWITDVLLRKRSFIRIRSAASFDWKIHRTLRRSLRRDAGQEQFNCPVFRLNSEIECNTSSSHKDKLLTLNKPVYWINKITVLSSLPLPGRPLLFWMLYCCGGREKGEQEHTGAEEALMSTGEADTVTAGNREESPATGMFDTADMPELLPPSEQLQTATRDSECGMQHLRVEVNSDCLSPESPQRRLGQRAPKLGQIGRSKRGEC